MVHIFYLVTLEEGRV